ncbi:MAG: RHS repeat-associated core domain-containing protein [Candidatus Micrarchaeota archaeon]
MKRKRVAKRRVGANILRRFALVAFAVLGLLACGLLFSDQLSVGFATLGKLVGAGPEITPALEPSAPPAEMGRPAAPTGATVYVYGKGLVASKSSDGAVLYYHQDALGSNRLVTDSGGQVQSKSTAYPYGEPVQIEGFGSKQARYTFTGKELDSKLYYYGARYYNPRTMRFTAVDPVARAGSNYEYAAGNPLKFVDPTGAEFRYNREVGVLKENQKYISAELKYFDKKLTPHLQSGDVAAGQISDMRTMIQRGDLLIANDLYLYSLGSRKIQPIGGLHSKYGQVIIDFILKGAFQARERAVLVGSRGDESSGIAGQIAINGNLNNDLFIAANLIHEYRHHLQSPGMSVLESELDAYAAGGWFELLNGVSVADLDSRERLSIFGSTREFQDEASRDGLYSFEPDSEPDSNSEEINMLDSPVPGESATQADELIA